jgi:hypothetical protein
MLGSQPGDRGCESHRGRHLGFRKNPCFTIPLKPGLFLKRYENIGLFNVRERKAVERSGLQPESLAGASPATDATLMPALRNS